LHHSGAATRVLGRLTKMPSICRWCVFVFLACRSEASLAEKKTEMPILEISLAPPSQPLPLISAAIGDMEASREKLEEAQMGDIERAAQKALQLVDGQIHVITDRLLRSMKGPAAGGALSMRLGNHESAHNRRSRPAAFLERRAGFRKDRILVQVHQAAATTGVSMAANIAKIHALENERTREESRTFHEADAEMNELVSVFSTELQAQVDKQVRTLLSSRPGLSFLETSEADYRVVPSDIAYPTVESLALDMERRRDTAETLVQARLTMEKLHLLQAANKLAKDKLEAVVGEIRRAMK